MGALDQLKRRLWQLMRHPAALQKGLPRHSCPVRRGQDLLLHLAGLFHAVH